ncbi:hypothetical protein [Mycobacterium deserti]|uniref:Uncharacterized protein n=1 Tax=Mycobacterium deserti TaxID=2978347 RepID=A0ABT2M7X8_9MYCO|nr:hypothetical protein [Mycobacterium deserti]MCT7658370.1 hypothetical protein [Mycobacterium deserti]
MRSSDLFSHPPQPEPKPNNGDSSKPVENPEFSDTSQRQSAAPSSGT